MNTSPIFGTSSLLVALGGGLGAWLRHLTGRAWMALVGPVKASTFPYSTLTVNVLGCLAMGILVGWLARHGGDFGLRGSGGESLRLLLGVGVLGGYTTFSSFALEFALFIERGTPGTAALYVALSLAAGFGGLFAGLWLMRGATA